MYLYIHKHVKQACGLPFMNTYLWFDHFSCCIFFDTEIHRYELCRLTKRIIHDNCHSFILGNLHLFSLCSLYSFQLRFVTPKTLVQTFVVTVVFIFLIVTFNKLSHIFISGVRALLNS